MPQTIVMYLCRKLREHSLQKIARVNRVYVGKDYGFIIDYAGIMHELEETMETYTRRRPNRIDGFAKYINRYINRNCKLHKRIPT